VADYVAKANGRKPPAVSRDRVLLSAIPLRASVEADGPIKEISVRLYERIPGHAWFQLKQRNHHDDPPLSQTCVASGHRCFISKVEHSV
jgi:hypothetical protein